MGGLQDWWDDTKEDVQSGYDQTVEWASDNPMTTLGWLGFGPEPLTIGLSRLIDTKVHQKFVQPLTGRSKEQFAAEEATQTSDANAAAKAAADRQALIDDYYGNLAGARKKRSSRLNAFSGAMGMGNEDPWTVLQPGAAGGGFR
jgi:hypothetical protein